MRHLFAMVGIICGISIVAAGSVILLAFAIDVCEDSDDPSHVYPIPGVGGYGYNIYKAGANENADGLYHLDMCDGPTVLYESVCNYVGGSYQPEAWYVECECVNGACVPQDSDSDGVVDPSDLCPATPAGEGVNAEGCSCSQIDIPFRDCPDDGCYGEVYIDYIGDGYDTCVDGVITSIHGCQVLDEEYSLECDPDDDDDGVPDEDDRCPDTGIPEEGIFDALLPNRYALVDDDLVFDTLKDEKEKDKDKPLETYAVADTYGCSCYDILTALNMASVDEFRHGCKEKTLEGWIALPPLDGMSVSVG
ncbi:hypothetical protein JXB02_05160 [Candidatus Woesearchaeota archaeon]|nr:hypothetical protein [Candidatus Woesearchaeota archaeon]